MADQSLVFLERVERDRSPGDFAFTLSAEENEPLRSQSATLTPGGYP